jgi:hypothetical protein
MFFLKDKPDGGPSDRKAETMATFDHLGVVLALAVTIDNCDVAQSSSRHCDLSRPSRMAIGEPS